MFKHEIRSDRHILLAGATGSGKSALALRLAAETGGIVVNADAMQVYANWRILTARPADDDLARAPHALFGHIGPHDAYSVGHWLGEIGRLIEGGARLIVTGGTGLYLSALTEGLARVPAIPPEVRAEADARIAAGELSRILDELDAPTRARLDPRNPARVQRAWEVLRATGQGLAQWQAEMPAPLLPPNRVHGIVLDAPADWLEPRLARRFDAMLDAGALAEVTANLDLLQGNRPSARAIGAQDLARSLRGEISLDAARQLALISTRRYAKRQRTWFRARMGDWRHLPAADVRAADL